jgi:hypothetical protein
LVLINNSGFSLPLSVAIFTPRPIEAQIKSGVICSRQLLRNVLVEDFLHQMVLRRSVWQIPAREFSAVVLFETAIANFPLHPARISAKLSHGV